MLIFGHKDIESKKLYSIFSISDIETTPPNSIILIDSLDIDILKFSMKNSVSVAIEVKTVREAILAENFDVKYIISDIELASKIQKIADNYLYDSKILAWIENDSELEKIAEFQIDGAIFRNGSFQ